MEWVTTALGILGAGTGLAGIWYARRANERSDKANSIAKESNEIARKSARTADESKEIAERADKRAEEAHKWSAEERERSEVVWHLTARRTRHGQIELELVNDGRVEARRTEFSASDFAHVKVVGILRPPTFMPPGDPFRVLIEDHPAIDAPKSLALRWVVPTGEAREGHVSTREWRKVAAKGV